MIIKRLMFALLSVVICLFPSSCKSVNEPRETDTSAEVKETLNSSHVSESETVISENTESKMYNLTEAAMLEIDKRIASVPKGKSFIYVTDQHFPSDDFSSQGRFNSLLNIIRYVADKSGINTVVTGGDIYGSEESQRKALEIINAYYSDGLCDMFPGRAVFVLGNHDANRSGGEENIIADTALYENTVKLLLEDGNVKLDEKGIDTMRRVMSELGRTEHEIKEAEEMMKMHYFLDDEENKIRYIVLDSGGAGYVQQLFNYTWKNTVVTQYRWLAESLDSAPSDFDIVVLCHDLTINTEANEGESPANLIFDIISAFKIKSSIDITYFGLNAEKNPELYSYAKSMGGVYDFSENKSSGKIFTLSGHVHGDSAHIMNNASEEDDDGSRNFKYEDVTAINERGVLSVTCRSDFAGENAHAFDIITILENGVVCTRIGAGKNREFSYK